MGEPTADTLLHLFEGLYRPRRLAQASPKTIEFYRAVLRALGQHLGRPPELTDFREEVLAPFLTAYSRHHAAMTVAVTRHKLLALWRFAFSRVPGIEEPQLAPWRIPRTNPTAWTIEEFSRLLAAARRFRPKKQPQETYCGLSPWLWWSAFLLLLFDTGFRRTAALELRWIDVNLEQGWAIARAQHQKTDRDECRALAPQTTAALQAIRWPERELVFPFGSYGPTFYRHYAQILRAAGLPTTHRDKTQRLRRTHATWLAVQAGKAAAQESLGHSSLRLTERAYLDQRFVRPLNAAALLPRPRL